MNDQEATGVLKWAVEQLIAAGYIPTGEICFCRPRTIGLLQPLMTVQPGPATSVKFSVIKPDRELVPNWVRDLEPQGPLAAAVLQVVEPAKAKLTKASAAILLGYTGSICSGCGSARMRRSGTCERCEECGQTSGCG